MLALKQNAHHCCHITCFAPPTLTLTHKYTHLIRKDTRSGRWMEGMMGGWKCHTRFFPPAFCGGECPEARFNRGKRQTEEMKDRKKGGCKKKVSRRQCQPPPSLLPPSFSPCLPLPASFSAASLEASLALCRVRPWWSLSWCEHARNKPYGWDRARNRCRDSRREPSNPWFVSVSFLPSLLPSHSHTHRLGYICAPSPLSLGQGQGQCPCHLTQGKGCICWEGGYYRGGEMGWVGSRWLSPKASAGVAGGECVRM